MADGNLISARPIAKRFIELTGTIGEFFLENKTVKIRYFSTIANGKDDGSHSLDLLRELKPMRERVKASELKDLDSLLQRNLNDNRVSNELIPYLMNTLPRVAFFTPILAVLIPKDLLSKAVESDYPIATKTTSQSTGNSVFSYNDLWQLEIYRIGGIDSNLGILSFDPNTVDLVVLDGQHRANAFRVVTGAFADKDSTVYPAFYNQIQPLKNFSADLPVTIVWFEVENSKFDPKIVSRRLFVDVNNTAKKVSTSRTILLEENEAISALVRFFYSEVAKHRSFDRHRFSLFHSGFDIDSDITISSDNPFSLTNPQLFYDIVAWITLGSKRYNNLASYQVARETFKNSTITFNSVFTSAEFNSNDIKETEETLDNRRIIISDPDKAGTFNKEYLEKLHNTLLSFFDRFNLLSVHFKACNSIDEWYSNGMDPAEMSVWKEVYCGGEGLYYHFKDSTIDTSKKQTLARFLKAMDSIEARFKNERSKLLPGQQEREVNLAFDSIKTKAFQIGIFMALDIYRGDNSFEESYESFFSEINGLSEKDWVYVLTEIRRKLMPRGATPKLWPIYQKLILRLIQNDDHNYYSESNFISSPDGRIFEGSLTSSFDAWYDANDSVDIDTLTIDSFSTYIDSWTNKAKNELEELYRPINKSIIPGDYIKEAKGIVERLVKNLQG